MPAQMAPKWLHVKECNHFGQVPLWKDLRYGDDMKNGIRYFREKAGISKAELARRIGTNRQQFGRIEDGKRSLTMQWAERIAKALPNATPQELMFPELQSIDTARFTNVFDVAAADDSAALEAPTVSLADEFVTQMLPSVKGHKLRLMMVDASLTNGLVSKGDAVIIDLDDNRPTRPGLYAVEIAGTVQWRHLSPTTAGKLQVSQNPSTPPETVEIDDIKVVGRGTLKISTI